MLVNTTLDRLATQAALASERRVSEGFISVGQLRDDVLRSTFSKADETNGTPDDAGRAVMDTRKWDEGRPIY